MMADVSLWQTALVSLVSAMIGGVFVHYLAGVRDRNAKRRELVVKHLVEIFQSIELGHNTKKPLPSEIEIRVGNAIRDIQLFGSNEQIEFAKHIGQGNSVPLLESMRGSLRSELGLEITSRELFYFEVNSRSADNKSTK